MSDTDKSRWKARKDTARILLTEQKNKHKAAHNQAVTNVVYADACKPAPGTHPAILLMETAHDEVQIHTARHHEDMFAIYDQALTKLETIPDESDEEGANG